MALFSCVHDSRHAWSMCVQEFFGSRGQDALRAKDAKLQDLASPTDPLAVWEEMKETKGRECELHCARAITSSSPPPLNFVGQLNCRSCFPEAFCRLRLRCHG